MTTSKIYGIALLAVILAAAPSFGQRAMSGGDAELSFTCISGGGAAFATNAAGTIKLGGTVGQSGLVAITTNDAGQLCLNGFWKAEDGCTLYNPTIVSVDGGAGGVGITFLVVNSNTYTVAFVNNEAGGLTAGTHAFTNIAVTPFTGRGGGGSTTTVWDNVVSATNAARFYLIRCEP